MNRDLSVTFAFHTIARVWLTNNLYIFWMGNTWVQQWAFSLIFKLYETWTHWRSSGRMGGQLYKIVKIYCKYKVSAFGYSNLRESKRLDTLWCLHVVNRPHPPLLLELMQQRRKWESPAASAAVLRLPTDICKLEKYKFHLDTFNFPPFLLYLPPPCASSTFCTVKCYYPVTSLIRVLTVHSDGFKLSSELFVYRLSFSLLWEYLRCTIWSNFSVFQSPFLVAGHH
jgi:hypothetical protein